MRFRITRYYTEIRAIDTEAQKAADGVKPWWKKALATVLKVVVSVVVFSHYQP